MRSRQIAERLGVEEAHMLEFQQFNAVWDKKMADYEKNAAELVLAMKVCVCGAGEAKGRGGQGRLLVCCGAEPPTHAVRARVCVCAAQERHAREIREFQAKLVEKQQRPKFSRELLNLRKIQVVDRANA